jgi:type IV pilus assembly protein PilV
MRRTGRALAARRGETLIEAMVSMAVFTIGVLGLLQMNVLASGQNGLALRQTTATMIARDLIDSLERIPYGSPLLAPADGVSHNDAGFADLDAEDTHKLEDDPGVGVRPMLGAAQATWKAEGGSSAYEVGWRVAQAEDAAGREDARHVVVMVRFRVPGAGTKQVELWTVKYNPEVVVGSSTAVLEI